VDLKESVLSCSSFEGSSFIFINGIDMVQHQGIHFSVAQFCFQMLLGSGCLKVYQWRFFQFSVITYGQVVPAGGKSSTFMSYKIVEAATANVLAPLWHTIKMRNRVRTEYCTLSLHFWVGVLVLMRVSFHGSYSELMSPSAQ
jgi:hypothetical protein